MTSTSSRIRIAIAMALTKSVTEFTTPFLRPTLLTARRLHVPTNTPFSALRTDC